MGMMNDAVEKVKRLHMEEIDAERRLHAARKARQQAEDDMMTVRQSYEGQAGTVVEDDYIADAPKGDAAGLPATKGYVDEAYTVLGNRVNSIEEKLVKLAGNVSALLTCLAEHDKPANHLGSVTYAGVNSYVDQRVDRRIEDEMGGVQIRLDELEGNVIDSSQFVRRADTERAGAMLVRRIDELKVTVDSTAGRVAALENSHK